MCIPHSSAITSTLLGPALAAITSLSPSQIAFLQSVPKAELHAHLNGSIPVEVLGELSREYLDGMNNSLGVEGTTKMGTDPILLEKIRTLLNSSPSSESGSGLDKISDFFDLFPAIYAVTSTCDALARATKGVLAAFLDPVEVQTTSASTSPIPAQCTYLELRTTPRATPHMDRLTYLLTVLRELSLYPAERVGLIVSLDRRMGEEIVRECMGILEFLCGEGEGDGDEEKKELGKRIVGVDLCGDPLSGDVRSFEQAFEQAKQLGLGVTVHIAETMENTPEETFHLLSYGPDRLGHATFLGRSAEAVRIVRERNTCVEVCLSSNLLCKTVPTLDAHHIHDHLQAGHPIAICTDDTLPFRTSLLAEYALLLAQPPLGLGLTEDEVRALGEMSMNARFVRRSGKRGEREREGSMSKQYDEGS